jgi:hypothetical protein
VVEAAAPAVEQVAGATAPVTQAAAPVVEQVADTAAPVVEAAAPAVEQVADAAAPVVEAAAPVFEQVAGAAAPVLAAAAPVVEAVAAPVEPIVTPVAQAPAPVTQAADSVIQNRVPVRLPFESDPHEPPPPPPSAPVTATPVAALTVPESGPAAPAAGPAVVTSAFDRSTGAAPGMWATSPARRFSASSVATATIGSPFVTSHPIDLHAGPAQVPAHTPMPAPAAPLAPAPASFVMSSLLNGGNGGPTPLSMAVIAAIAAAMIVFWRRVTPLVAWRSRREFSDVERPG